MQEHRHTSVIKRQDYSCNDDHTGRLGVLTPRGTVEIASLVTNSIVGPLPKRAPLKDMRVVMPFDRLKIDLTGPHIPVNGFQYICTAIDAFTKFVIAWPTRDKKATTTAKGIVEHVFLPYGASRYLLTDNGLVLENELFWEVCRILGVQKQHTTPYHSARNGAIERCIVL